jgi:DNA-binding MarR family transcriptional regulator
MESTDRKAYMKTKTIPAMAQTARELKIASMEKESGYSPAEGRLSWLLSTSSRALGLKIEQILNSANLTDAQFHALQVISALAPTTAAAVARVTKVSAQTSSVMVPALEKKGYITRTVVDGSGHRILLEMTPLGKRTLTAARKKVAKLESAVAGSLGEGGFPAAVSALEALCDFLGS